MRNSLRAITAVAGVAIVLLWTTVGGADQRVVFRWGRSMRIATHELDLQAGRLVLTLPQGGSVTIPLSIVRRVIGPNGEVLFDLDLGAVRRDPDEPPDAVPWIPAGGWSGTEVWDRWENTPKWEYRWTDEDSASALIPAPPEAATEVELRLLPISYAIRVLGGIGEPETQTVAVALDGHPLGTIRLSHDGWKTYRLPLPPGPSRDTAVLSLQTGYRARPHAFTEGTSSDRRILGVALDYVRYCPCP